MARPARTIPPAAGGDRPGPDRRTQVRAGDAVEDLADTIALVAGHGHPVVLNTWVLNYLSDAQRRAYVAELDRLGASADLSWIYAEMPALVSGLPVPDDPEREHRTVVTLVRWRDGVRTVDHLADAHPHGVVDALAPRLDRRPSRSRDPPAPRQLDPDADTDPRPDAWRVRRRDAVVADPHGRRRRRTGRARRGAGRARTPGTACRDRRSATDRRDRAAGPGSRRARRRGSRPAAAPPDHRRPNRSRCWRSGACRR